MNSVKKLKDMNAKEFYDTVVEMRKAQKEYFRTRTPSALQHSKQLERLIDKEKINAYMREHMREYNREYFRDPRKRERKNERARLNYALHKDEINARRRDNYKERKTKKANP